MNTSVRGSERVGRTSAERALEEEALRAAASQRLATGSRLALEGGSPALAGLPSHGLKVATCMTQLPLEVRVAVAA